MEDSAIIARIENILKIENILEKLDQLSPTDLQSLLLATYERRAKNITAQSVASQYEKNKFVCPSGISQKLLTEIELLALDLLPSDFNAVELSPVVPFGTISALTRNSQKKIMSTVRNLEVCADSTTALILECARRRKDLLHDNAKNVQEVKCATNMRNIRLQSFADIPGFLPHFKALTLATAGRDCGNETFEVQSCLEHVSFFLDYLRHLSQKYFWVDGITVAFSDIRVMEKLIEMLKLNRTKIGRDTQNPGFDAFRDFQIPIPTTVKSMSKIPEEFIQTYGLRKSAFFLSKVEEEIANVLNQKYPQINFSIDLGRIAGIGYYSNLCFKIMARNKRGDVFPLVDGGMVDWTQKLLQSRKERSLASGFGTELLCQNFRK
jgi:hypothetical protein